MFGQDESAHSTSKQSSDSSQLDVRIHTSAFYSYGLYSTMTVSKSVNTFLTLEHQRRNFYTVGYHWLSFSRDDIGKDYFTEYSFLGKGTSWFGSRINASVFYAYNHQSAIDSNSFTYHAFGANGNYWFSGSAIVGFTYSGAIQIIETDTLKGNGYRRNQSTTTSDYAVNNYSGHLSYNLGSGIWVTTSAIVSDSRLTGQFLFVRQNASVSLGKYTRVNVSAGFGRRTFYFDEDLLLLYNQPEVQTGGYMLGGTIGISKHFNIAPSFEYDTFDSYTITYSSLGFRYSF
ncbi:MAG: hypothetical protein HYZ34_04980 [Ignavibacteriae bacterium]|nr:hypothetical protein [Ignavibacteriota bacterium]